jgi:hypothetical protein
MGLAEPSRYWHYSIPSGQNELFLNYRVDAEFLYTIAPQQVRGNEDLFQAASTPVG